MGTIGKAGLPTGTTVAGYRIERELGRGNMAIVYLATQLNLERHVALKIMTEEMAEDEEFVGRFFNEARAAAALTHPNIVQAYDAGVTEGNVYYFAMEYVEGETLEDRVQREGFLEPPTAIRMALDIAEALDYGWQHHRLTHGDIKPENIMLDKHGQTKLADFGLAKVAGQDFQSSSLMLTPLYAPPEVIQGQHVSGDCRADIYSFGATLYHMLAGTPPFAGTNPDEVMQRQVSEPITPLYKTNPSVPKEVSDNIGFLLVKPPEQRPADWQTVIRILKGVANATKTRNPASATGQRRVFKATARTGKLSAGPRPARARRGGPPRQSSPDSPGLTIFVVVLLVILFAAFVWFISTGSMPVPPTMLEPPPPAAEQTGPSPPAAG